MKLKLIAVITLAGLAQGCSILPYAQSVKSVEADISGHQKVSQTQNADRPAFRVHDGFYLGSGNSSLLPSNELLPPLFSQKVTLSSTAITLKEAGAVITEHYGVRVNIQEDADDASSETIAGANPITTEVVSKREAIKFSGDLAGLSDTLASVFDLSWRYKNGQIEFYSWETRSFMLAMPSETVDSTLTFENTGANGIKDHVVTAKASADNIEELTRTISNMLTSNGKASYSTSSGMMTVTDSPTTVSQVSELIEVYNKVMMRQVSIEVNVYNVTTDESAGGGLDLNMAFSGSSRVGVTSLAPGSVMPAAGLGGATAVLLSGRFASSSVVATALKSVGQVSLETSGSGVILNNQTMPIQNTKTTGYLKSVTTTSTVNAGVETQLESDTINTGFAMTVTPRIMDDRSVILSYGMSLSSLDRLNTVSTNGQSIQTPEISAMKTMQRVSVRAGSTLVLSGFAKDRNTIDSSEGLTGASRMGSKSRTVTVVAITVNDVSGAL